MFYEHKGVLPKLYVAKNMVSTIVGQLKKVQENVSLLFLSVRLELFGAAHATNCNH